jgi:Skp family chaperone for outer membrane proteins
MKRIRFILVMALSAPAMSGAIWGLDIPLTGATPGSSSDATRGGTIGYVDMEKIFQIYPQTQAAKEDYAKQLKKKREQLAEKEAALAEIQSRAAVLESTLKQGAPPAAPVVLDSSSTASSVPAVDPLASAAQSLATMKRDLEDKKAEMEELRKQSAADLAAFEAQQSQLILGKIYQALRDVANEEQVTVVVDKSSILYGDASIDLTDKLQQRVRGY